MAACFKHACLLLPAPQRVVFEDPRFQDWIESLACLACGGGDNEEQLLLCDGKLAVWLDVWLCAGSLALAGSAAPCFPAC